MAEYAQVWSIARPAAIVAEHRRPRASLVFATGVMAAVISLTAAVSFAAAPVESKFPARPVRMVVPFAPGGGSDIVGRILAQGLQATWNQTVVVDNRPGAGSTVGTGLITRAVPDGYSLLVASSAVAFSPSLYSELGYDPTRDLVGVSLLARQPSVLVISGAVAAHSVGELISLARNAPGKLAFGSAGHGSATHLGGELLRFSAKIDMTHVPYKSAGLAMTALLAGEVQVLLTNTATVLPHLKSGRVRALATSGRTRAAIAADLPTIAESGLAGFEYDTWYGMFVPARTPRMLVERLNGDAARVLRDKVYFERLGIQGIEVVAGTPRQLDEYLRAEIVKWAKVIRAAGTSVQ